MKNNNYKPPRRYTFKNFVLLWHNLRPYHYECPLCTERNFQQDDYEHTVIIKSMWDEMQHQYKFYGKCRACKYVTPAYESIKQVLDHMDTDLALLEEKTVLCD